MQGPVKVWRRKQDQSNDVNNHQHTKVWRIKLVDQDKNDGNLGRTQCHFEDHRPVIWSVQRMCKSIYVHLIIRFKYRIVVGSNSICVAEYKSIKVASVVREATFPKEYLAAINANMKKSWKGREVDDKGSMPWGGAVWSKDVPFAIDSKGGEKLWIRGTCSKEELWCCHQWQRGILFF